MFRSAGHAQFDKLIEKSTSHLLLEPDWASIIQICDLIRQKDCQPKYALAAIKKKLTSSNPHVSMFALQVLESVVKNCGSPIHEEVTTKTFMEEFKDLAKTTQHENVREKVLELLQTWAHAFRKITSYRAVQDVLNIMKAEGAKFPPLVETDAMFVADNAPAWVEGNCCHRCRTEFGLVNRKHHCRACGNIFCSKCSSKQATLPKFGIEKEVRVCDSCYEKYGREIGGLEDMEEFMAKTGSLPVTAPAPKPSAQAPKGKTEEELAEEEQLQLAIAISQSEAEAKERESRKGRGSIGLNNSAPTFDSGPSKIKAEKSGGFGKSSEEEDPELARYLNRNYWEKRQSGPKDEAEMLEEKNGKGLGFGNFSSLNSFQFQPSAPIKSDKEGGEKPEQIHNFVETLRAQIEMFVNRMKANSSRGRPISNDTSVQGLFMNITALHPQLLEFIQAQVDARGQYEGLQDKLSEVSNARGALDALRKEHEDQLRREAEEQEQIRKQQMNHKLFLMRQQKQQLLQYQREVQLQRMQEHERQMQLRIEQQNQLPQPGAFMHYPPQFIPQGGYMGSVPVQGVEMPYMGVPGSQGYQPMPHNVMAGGMSVYPGGPQQAQYLPQQQQPGMIPQQMHNVPQQNQQPHFYQQQMGPGSAQGVPGQQMPPPPQGQMPPPPQGQMPPIQMGQGPPTPQMGQVPSATQMGHGAPQMGQGPPSQMNQGPPQPQLGQGPPQPQMGQGPPHPQMGQGPQHHMVHGPPQPQMGQAPQQPQMNQAPPQPQIGQGPPMQQLGQVPSQMDQQMGSQMAPMTESAPIMNQQTLPTPIEPTPSTAELISFD